MNRNSSPKNPAATPPTTKPRTTITRNPRTSPTSPSPWQAISTRKSTRRPCTCTPFRAFPMPVSWEWCVAIRTASSSTPPAHPRKWDGGVAALPAQDPTGGAARRGGGAAPIRRGLVRRCQRRSNTRTAKRTLPADAWPETLARPTRRPTPKPARGTTRSTRAILPSTVSMTPTSSWIVWDSSISIRPCRTRFDAGPSPRPARWTASRTIRGD
mmetsp:Transcript_20545/g.35330  ORF Transcript_20545/g.35330 Transcript_20545/m.35330 type:complete len:213 (+) Transcript_20545:442-1080(+)